MITMHLLLFISIIYSNFKFVGGASSILARTNMPVHHGSVHERANESSIFKLRFPSLMLNVRKKNLTQRQHKQPALSMCV